MSNTGNRMFILAISYLLIGCAQQTAEPLVLEYNGEVVGLYDDLTGVIEFAGAPEVLSAMEEHLAGEAQLSYQGHTVDIPSDLQPVSFVPGLAAGDTLVFMLGEYSREGSLAYIPAEEQKTIFDGSLQLKKRGNKKKGETCTEHWHSGQRNKDKDCKWPWNCYGPYSASHPKYGDGVLARCVCHF